MFKFISVASLLFSSLSVNAELLVDLNFDGDLDNSASGIIANVISKEGGSLDYVEGRFGDVDGALKFDGNWLSLSDSLGEGSGLGVYTVSAWVKLNITDNELVKRSYVYDFRGSSGKNASAIFIDDFHNDEANSIKAFGDNVYKGQSLYGSDAWVHIASTYDSINNLSKHYVNGEVFSVYNKALAANLDNFYIGGYFGDAGKSSSIYTFNGAMDDFRIYDEAVSDSEVKALFETGESSVKDVPAPFGVALLPTLFFMMRRKS